MRLDNFVSKTMHVTRTEAKKLISRGRITLNNSIEKSSKVTISESDQVHHGDTILELSGPCYLLLNKPTAYICSTVDELQPSALRLIDLPNRDKLHFAGRLDADTTGLVIISNDGQWTHRITSPRYHHMKRYIVDLAEPISEQSIAVLRKGIKLNNEVNLTLPALVEKLGDAKIKLSISEGRYHQVKRMLAATNNRVIKLHRDAIGELELSDELAVGEWRYLTELEIALF
ncbi:MAG: pseudouridine synthase [Kangiellaceae bacterium]|nr:pseudouridine synthase [Kangiellaceae bacterium]